MIQLGILIHIRRVAVLHLDGQRRDGTERARLSAAISRGDYKERGRSVDYSSEGFFLVSAHLSTITMGPLR